MTLTFSLIFSAFIKVGKLSFTYYYSERMFTFKRKMIVKLVVQWYNSSMKLRLAKATYRSKLSSLLIAAFVSLFCVQIAITPVSAAKSEKQKVDTFFKEYDPEKEYHSAPEAVISMPDGSPIEGEVEEGEWVFEEFNNEEFQKKEAKKAGKPVPKKLNWWEKTTQWAGEQYRKGKKWVQSKVQQVTGKEKKTQKKPVLKKVNQKQPQSKWEQFKGWVGEKVEGVKKTVALTVNNIKTEIKRQETMKNVEKKYDINLVDDYNPIINRDGKKWSEKELEWFDDVFEKLPKNQYDHKELDKIVRSNETPYCGVYLAGTVTISDAALECRINNLNPQYDKDNITENDKELSFKRTLIHEVNHSYQENNQNVSDRFATFSFEKTNVIMVSGDGTKEDKIETVQKWKLKSTNKEQFVTEYSGNTTDNQNGDNGYYQFYSEEIGLPGEDMSESVAMYIMQPEKLKQTSSKKYEFLKKNVFGGKEYYNVDILN